MTYRKKIMCKRELIKENDYTEGYLLRVFMTPGQKVAWYQNPANPRSPLLFDTELLEEFRAADIKVQQRVMKRRSGIM